MRKIIDFWRWYSLSREQYYESMNKQFMKNLYFLRYTNLAVVILTTCFSVFPFVIDKSFIRSIVYIIAAAVSLLLFFVVRQKINQLNQERQVSKFTVYLLITLYHLNITLFGTYLGVWSNSDNYAVTFMCLLICSLFLFTIPAQTYLCLTLGAMALFIVSTVYVKSHEYWIPDVINVLGAGCISLSFGWQLTMRRLVYITGVGKIEDERDIYYAQSTIDELTGLRNRRDFEQTFRRYMTSHRSYDEWMCIAIADIDFFKDYNDHYGHPNGDVCLRSIGGVLNNMGIYTARVGGEEFALLWFEKEIAHIDKVVARLTNMIKELKIPHEKSIISPYVTLSIGVYVHRCDVQSEALALYDLADKALYIAKNDGRNCAIVCGNEIEQYKITPTGSTEN